MRKKMRVLSLLLGVIFLVLCHSNLTAQGKKIEEMNVDMPDETQETDIVDKGQWQAEVAYLHNIYKDNGHSAIGQALLRYGLSSKLEVRVLVEAGHQLRHYIEETVQSTYPVSVSAKYVVLKDHKALPDITLISFLQVPFNPKYSDKKVYWSPIFIAAFQYEFGDKWKLEFNGGGQQEAYSTSWAVLGNTSLHYKIIDQLEVFTEYFAQYHHLESPEHNVGAGLAYQLNNHLEFFAMTGSTINNPDYNHYYNAGLAFRTFK